SVNLQLSEIKDIVNRRDHIELFISADKVDELMLKSDLAIISPGTISYEAACMGLPMILIPIADNQLMNAEGWSEIGCALSLEEINKIAPEALISAIRDLANSSERLSQMSTIALNAVDGLGAVRVRDKILLKI